MHACRRCAKADGTGATLLGSASVDAAVHDDASKGFAVGAATAVAEDAVVSAAIADVATLAVILDDESAASMARADLMPCAVLMPIGASRKKCAALPRVSRWLSRTRHFTRR